MFLYSVENIPNFSNMLAATNLGNKMCTYRRNNWAEFEDIFWLTGKFSALCHCSVHKLE